MVKLIDANPLVQRYRSQFALFDWTALEPAVKPTGPGRPAHSPSAYVKALLVRIGRTSQFDAPLAGLLAGPSPAGARTGLPSAPGLQRVLWLPCQPDRAE